MGFTGAVLTLTFMGGRHAMYYLGFISGEQTERKFLRSNGVETEKTL